MTPTEASECVAEKFTRVMNATPSPLGPLSDLGVASVLSGVIVVLGFFGIRRSTDAAFLYVVLGLAALPLAANAALSLPLRGSREKVVAWLCTVPFPIDNLNALLAGLGDTVEIALLPGTELPARATLQPQLDAISEDMLLVKERADVRTLEIRLGVIDSKRMPLRTNHQRWTRFVDLIEKVVIPLHQRQPVERLIIV